MKSICYALKPGFADFIQSHPDLLNQLSTLSEEQCKALIQKPDEEELCQRAIHYFHNDDIYLSDHIIYYENALKKTIYTMQSEDNPFLPFLRRIYRSFITCPQKDEL